MIRRAAIIVLSLFVSAHSATAESVFSVNGIGEVVLCVDARGMAMGGAGLANPSAWHISMENPALLARVGQFTLGAALVPEIRSIALKDSLRGELVESEEGASFAYFPFVRLTHGLPGNLTGAAAIGSMHRVSYSFEERYTVGGREVTDVRSGEGGPGYVSIALARPFGKRLMIGAELRVLVGTIEDERRVSFVDELALDTHDIVKSSFGGEPLGRFGAYVDIGGGFGVGGSYQFSRVMDVTTTLIARNVEISRSESELDYPAMGGLGFSYTPGKKTTFTAEWYRAGWGRTGALPGFQGEMADADRFSLGAEWKLGDDDYMIPLRVGYLWRELSYKASYASEAPTEFAVTVGFGLPFRHDNGSFDAALQIGSRGDLDADKARERYLRFSLSMVGTEFLEHLMPSAD